MAFPLLLGLAVAAIPVGAAAIAKASRKDPTRAADGSLIIPIYGTKKEPDTLALLAAAAAAYYLAKKAKVI